MNDEFEIIKKSTSTPSMCLMTINGVSFCIFGGVTEFEVQKRKGWIERELRASGNYNLDEVANKIKLSNLWLNYTQLGSKYPSVIDEEIYAKWDKDVVKPVIVPQSKSNNVNNVPTSSTSNTFNTSNKRRNTYRKNNHKKHKNGSLNNLKK